MSSTPACSKPSANTWWWMANTSGSTRTGPSTSACWATLRSLFPSSGPNRKFPDMPSAPAFPNTHGFTAYVVMSSVAARFFGPQVSGIGATPAGSGVFRIDHDEKFNETTHLQYQPFKRGPWVGFNWRYDSGLVAGPVPCAGGNCANGPNGTDSIVDVSGITPDQQFEAGLSCSGVFATPTTPISSDRHLPGERVRFQVCEDSGARHRKRRSQPAPHRAPQPLRPLGG